MKQINIILTTLFLTFIQLNAQCNGDASICNKNYDEVAYLTTHNAYNSAEDNFNLPNQDFDITSQLNDGVRALMIDVYDVNGTSTVYHGFSSLGSASLSSFLVNIKTFLDNNPNEVVTIILECYTTADKIESDMTSSGLINETYTHTGGSWPTLQKMIDDDTRLVVLSDRNDADSTQGWYHYVWDHAVETHFKANSLTDFNCDFNRGNPTNDLFILNHFITNTTLGTGIESEAIIANSNPYFINRVLECYEEKDKFPNFITVDFYDKGDGLDVVNQLNQTHLFVDDINNDFSNKLSIYPNPSTLYIQVSGLNKKEDYTIYNLLGLKVKKGEISSNEKINIEKLSNGLYFLKLENGNSLKFLKK